MLKTILSKQLSRQPDDAKQNIMRAFANVNCNFEFVVEVDFLKMKQHMDEASAKGFAPVWGDDGAKTTNGTAKIYSAGTTHEGNFKDWMTWLNNIRAKNSIAFVHYMGNDGEKFIEIR